LIGESPHGVRLLGTLPAQLPPLAVPDFAPDTMRLLAPGGLAIALLGLVEALSIYGDVFNN
jgi:SulP family sulfate permease